ncbi:MATE family efflux transporter [Echinimonas agarilytica]|uniref:MATE family efflux transporter n=1 Tax=Echinimonas agarilytica TaxID=1215918 RepID=A0AA41WAH8_9GAMM|nr:MATE family efflux transporter [Echinimonas agarilytica]MCM2680909.1 MATE family efflux transporter [Echinimonas agarilytica]
MTNLTWRSAVLHRQIGSIAIPMVLANLTVPLLGLVDTAVIGHLDSVVYLGGVAVGSMVVTLIYWLAGFLRMSTTGSTAQALGRNDAVGQSQILLQGLGIAFSLGLMLVVFWQPIWWLARELMQASVEVAEQAKVYFSIRIFGAPAALANLVFIGWLIGRQKSQAVMRLVILTNVVNITLDVVFVVFLGFGVAGAASATVCADLFAMLFAGRLCFKQLPDIKQQIPFYRQWGAWQNIKPLLSMNRDILMRSLALQMCLAFMTAQAARLGDVTVAANAVLMNFLMLISYGLDGVAYSAEAMVGQSVGERNQQRLKTSIAANAFWSLALAIIFAFGFAFGGAPLINLLTNLPDVQHVASEYLIYMIIMPLAGVGCFLLDGIFVGLTATKTMRNTMVLSSVGVFFPVWWATQSLGNHALWIAFLSFLAARSLTLGFCLIKRISPEKN